MIRVKNLMINADNIVAVDYLPMQGDIKSVISLTLVSGKGQRFTGEMADLLWEKFQELEDGGSDLLL